MIDCNTYKVGIYLRLSREDKNIGESDSIITQRQMLINYINSNNLLFIDEYVDDGISGTTFNRSGFNRMIKDIENKKINMVITKDTSRLGRDHIDFGYYVERYFPEHNVRYVAINDNVDTFNTSSNDMLMFKSAFNDMYVKDISNKMRTSLYTKKKSGKFVGCYAPYGYKKDPMDKHKLIIDPLVVDIVKRIFTMSYKGFSVTKICEVLTEEHILTPSMYKKMNCGKSFIHLGVWNSRTVMDILKNPTYAGHLTQGRNRKINYKSKKRIHVKENEWITKENSCPKIIDEHIFNRVKERLVSNRYQKNSTNSLLLSGLVYCKECHHTIGFRYQEQKTKKGNIKRIYGNCNYWVKRKKLNLCTPHSIKYYELEEKILENIHNLCGKININDLKKNILVEKELENKNKAERMINKYQSLINNNNNKIEIIYNDRLEGIIDLNTYQKLYKEITSDNEIILKKIKELKDKKTNSINLIFDINRIFIVNLIDKIEIDCNKKISIYYKIKI